MAEQSRISKQTLSAFVDGELPSEEMSRVAREIEGDAQARAYVEAQSRLRRTLRDAFASLSWEEVPRQLVEAAATAPISWRFRLLNWLQDHRLALQTAIPAGALAAGLLIGIAIERAGSSDNLVAMSAQSGRAVAHAELAFALEHQLAADTTQGPVRIGVSFRSRSGTPCRTFDVSAANSDINGMACRSGGEWQIAVLNAAPASGTREPEYGQAASEMSDAVRNAVSSAIVGLPFDMAQERRARDHGWN